LPYGSSVEYDETNRLLGVARLLESKSIREVWQEIERVMNEKPEPILAMNVVYQYDITGDDSGTFQLLISYGTARVIEGPEANPDCTLKISDKNFKKMIMGKLNGTAAFMTGKLKVQGSMGLALKLEGILNEYNLSETA
jgi:putative sterol carrier protein